MAAEVSFESFSIQNANNTDTADVVLTQPSGLEDGDLLIAQICRSNAGGSTLSTVPSGWTQIQLTGSGGASVPILGTYYKVASSEPASWTWSFSGSTTGTGGAVIRLSDHNGVDTSAADQSSSDGGGSVTFTNTITPSEGDGMLIFAIAVRGNTAGSSAYAIATDDPTWTERLEDDSTGGYVFALATAQRSETSATGDSSATVQASQQCAGHLIYINLDRNATGTFTHLAVSPTLYKPTPEAGVTATHSHVAVSPTINKPTRVKIDNKRWTDTEEPTASTWTDEEK